MRDLSNAVPGYLNDEGIRDALERTPVVPGVHEIPENLRRRYSALVDLGEIAAAEFPLLDAWLADLAGIRSAAALAARTVK